MNNFVILIEAAVEPFEEDVVAVVLTTLKTLGPVGVGDGLRLAKRREP